MKKINITARTGKEGTPSYKEVSGEAKRYESVSEALKELKEESTLKLINAQSKANSLNALRKSIAEKKVKELSFSKMVTQAPPEAKEEIEAILKKHGIKKAA